MVVTFMMRRANMFLQNTIKEAKIKYRKHLLFLIIANVLKALILNQDNSCTQKTLLSLDYVSI